MTTTVDPFGTQQTIYNRSGATLQNVTVLSGNYIPVVCPSGVSHIVVDSNSNAGGDGIELPASADIGDMVYVFDVNSGWSLNVFPASGDTIMGYASALTIAPTSGGIFVRDSATSWVAIR